MRRFLDMADRQLGELAEQRRQLDATMDELRALRDRDGRGLGADSLIRFARTASRRWPQARLGRARPRSAARTRAAVTLPSRRNRDAALR